jgi:hypothetical protein
MGGLFLAGAGIHAVPLATALVEFWYAVSKHKKSKKRIVMPESCRSGFIYVMYNFNGNYKSTNADEIFSIG